MNIPNLFYYPEEKFKKVFTVPDIGDLHKADFAVQQGYLIFRFEF